MATPAHDKYFLKSLHDEIDLFDRKLAHLEKYEGTDTEAERKASAAKMTAKRETLAKTARKLVSEGIEFKSADLPRSFRDMDAPSDAPHTAKAPAVATEAPVSAPAPKRMVSRSPSPFAGTVLDGQASIEAYKRGRSKPGLSQA